MPTRRELKNTARLRMQEAKPHACLVAIVFIVLTWLLSFLSQKVSGVQIIVHPEALYTENSAEAFEYVVPKLTVFAGLLMAAFELLEMLLTYGYTFYCLQTARKEKAGVANLFDGFYYFLRLLGLWLLTGLIVFAWSLLLVIPGIIAAYRYSMAPYLLYDHPDWSVVRCLRESRTMMKGHKWELFVLQLSFIGWLLLACIPGVNVFVSPYMSITEALYYCALTGTAASEPEKTTDGEEKPPWEY